MYISELHDYSQDDSETCKKFLTEQRREAIKKEVSQIIDDEYDKLVEHCGSLITEHAATRATSYIEALLRGDKDAAKKLLGGNDSDRYRTGGSDGGQPWASMIHGELFETYQIRMRRMIVEAYPEIITDARIKDLESVVEGLQLQIKEQNQKIDSLQNGY